MHSQRDSKTPAFCGRAIGTAASIIAAKVAKVFRLFIRQITAASCAQLTPRLSSGRSITCERSELAQPPDCFDVR
jgi:hypothetical protein